MLEVLRAGRAEVVLVWHADRLHRSNIELEDYINVVEPRQLCTIARYESEHRAERVHMARERQGRFGGGRRPYGFEADGLTVIPAEAAVIIGMTDAVLSGVPLRSIARDLRKLGVPTASGTEWTPEGVRGVLLRPRNAGFMANSCSYGQGQSAGGGVALLGVPLGPAGHLNARDTRFSATRRSSPISLVQPSWHRPTCSPGFTRPGSRCPPS
jgi:hypothetical protein